MKRVGNQIKYKLSVQLVRTTSHSMFLTWTYCALRFLVYIWFKFLLVFFSFSLNEHSWRITGNIQIFT